MSQYMAAMGIAAQAIGGAVAAYGVAQMLLRVPLGLSADRLAMHHRVIPAGLLCTAVASLIMTRANSPVLFVLSRALAGVSASAWVCFTVLYAGYYPPNEVARAMGVIDAMNYTGVLCGYALGVLLADRIGVVGLGYISVCMAVLGCVLACRLKPMPGGSKQTPGIRQLKSILLQPRLLCFAGLAALYQALIFSTVNSFPAVLVVDAQASRLWLALAAMLFTGSNVAGSFFVGRPAVQKLGMRLILAIGFCGVALYCLLVSMATAVWQILPLQLLGGTCGAALLSYCMAQAVAKVCPAQRSTAMGMFQALYAVGMSLGPLFMGRLVELIDMRPAYQFAAAVALVAALLGQLIAGGFADKKLQA